MSRLAALALGLLTCITPAPAAAQPLPLGSATIVNSELDLDARWARIDAADNGSFRVVWHQEFVGSGFDVPSRRLQANGALGPESTLNSFVTGNQLLPDCAMNGSGDWAAVWLSYGQWGPGTGGHVFARRTSSDGTLLSAELPIDDPTETAEVVAPPAVTIDVTDEMAVAWTDGGNVVRFERSSPAGVGMGAFVVDVANSWDPFVSVAGLGEDRAVVAWTDFDGAGMGVALRCVTNTEVLGPSVPVNTTTTGSQNRPTLAAAPDGHFAVLWYSSVGESRLRARLFDRDCTPMSAEIAVDDSSSSPTADARIGIAGDGSFVVVWDILVDGNDILAREFTKSGKPVDSTFSVLGAAFGSPELPDVAVGRATFAVVWNAPDFGLDGSDDVLVRRFARRVVFTDDFETDDTSAWSAVAP